MCTITTIDREFYAAHRDAVRAQLVKDSWMNGDGCALLTVGVDPNDTSLLRTMNVESMLALLDSAMDSGAERAWIHMRYATTLYSGVNGCHGFAAGDWTVMHNGVLSRDAADQFAVDSELIAEDIRLHGVEHAIDMLATHESYANVFLINNTTGQYHVVRMVTGELFGDGLGNYCSNKLGPIEQPVPQRTRTDFEEEIVVRRVVTQRITDAEYQTWLNSEVEYDARRDVDGDQIDCLPYADTIDDFSDMAEYEGWLVHGVSEHVWRAMTPVQKQWTIELGVAVSA